MPDVTGSTTDALIMLVRDASRMFGLMPQKAGEEFFKLALEEGVPDGHARQIRDAALKVRTGR